jgi:hypothetical protein
VISAATSGYRLQTLFFGAGVEAGGERLRLHQPSLTQLHQESLGGIQRQPLDEEHFS